MKLTLLLISLFFSFSNFAQQAYQKTKPIYFGEGMTLTASLPKPEVRTFKYPQHMVVDSKGNVYVARPVGYISGDRIIKITADGNAADYIGYLTKDSRNFTIQNKNIGTIKGMVIDENDNIYLSSTDNAGAVKKISPGGEVTRIAGAPQRDQGSKSGDYDVKDGTGEQARFWDPGSIAVDKSGNLYVLDGGRYKWDKAEGKHGYIIRKITPGGDVTTLRSDTGLLRFDLIRGLTCDKENNLLIALPVTRCIKKLSPGGILSTVVGKCGTRVTNPLYIEGDVSKAEITDPFYMTVAQNGDIWFTDSRLHRVIKISGNKITTIAGNSKIHKSNIAGGAYEGYRDGPAKQALFNSPQVFGLMGKVIYT